MTIEAHRQQIQSRIQTPGFIDRKVVYPLMDVVVERAQRGKRISSWFTKSLLYSGESRVSFEAETGHRLTRNGAGLVVLGILESVPLFGDAGDTVAHIAKDVANGRLMNDTPSALTEIIAAVIPFVPSIAAAKAKEALEDGVMASLLRRDDQRVHDAISRAARRGAAKRNL